MTYFPVPVEEFGGLRLDIDPGEVGFGGAIDLCDVDFNVQGALRVRDFWGAFTTTTQTGPLLIEWPGFEGFVAAGPTTLDLYDKLGSAIATAVAAPGQLSWGEPFGTATNSYLYLVDSTTVGGTYTARRLTTAGVLSAPAGMPKSQFLGRTPWDNRLVAANISTVPAGSTATASGSLVHFSNAGDGETWGANNWIALDPGDGESITGIARWGNLLFVFKPRKFYVFYGTSTDSSGNPIFNYRRIETNLGIDAQQPGYGLATAGNEGLYFVAPSGVYVTTGGQPVKISGALDPLFQSRYPAFFTPGTITQPYQVRYINRRLYLYVKFVDTLNANSRYLLVYDPGPSRWTMFSVPSTITNIASVLDQNWHATPIISTTAATAPVYQLQPSFTSDAFGAGPTSRYQSGFENLSPPRRYIDRYGFGPSRKRIRSWRVQGSGTVTMAVAADFGSMVGSTALTLGTSPAIAEVRYSRAIRGSKIGFKLSGTGAWSVNDLVAFIADTRESASDVSD